LISVPPLTKKQNQESRPTQPPVYQPYISLKTCSWTKY